MLRAKIVALILAVFGVHGHQALKVATCESRLHPRAQHTTSVGLFQIDYLNHRRGESFAAFRRRMWNPRQNVLEAFRLSKHGADFSPWRWSRHCWG